MRSSCATLTFDCYIHNTKSMVYVCYICITTCM